MIVDKNSKRRALIIGVSGQDGAYLSKFLDGKNYEVYGTSRNLKLTDFSALQYVGAEVYVNKIQMIPSVFESVRDVIERVQPHEIYNLSAQSSVSISFQKPALTINSITLTTLNILEAIRVLDLSTKFYNAGSGEVFGETMGRPADETTAFKPVSPYGLAKAIAADQVSMYRNVYDMYACTGILFNHESPLRPDHYVTKKIIAAACRIGAGSDEKLKLGNIDIARDWGYAPEYVDAMWRMLQIESPQDFVIATGKSISLKRFIAESFSFFDLNWEDHVVIENTLMRPSDIAVSSANPEKAELLLNWQAQHTASDLVRTMIKCEKVSNEK